MAKDKKKSKDNPKKAYKKSRAYLKSSYDVVQERENRR